MRMKDVDNENEWICVIICASIDSAKLLRTEALSSVNGSKMNVSVCALVVVTSVCLRLSVGVVVGCKM